MMKEESSTVNGALSIFLSHIIKVLSALSAIIRYDEGRVFNSERCSKYLLVPHNQGVVCLVCHNTI